MHTFSYDNFVFNHNGDFSGNVIIKDLSGGIEEVPSFEVPFLALKALVANFIRHERISWLEDATPEDILATRIVRT